MKKFLLPLFLISFSAFSQEISKRDFSFGLGLVPKYEVDVTQTSTIAGEDVEFDLKGVDYFSGKNSFSALVPHLQFTWDYRVTEAGPGRVTMGFYLASGFYLLKDDNDFYESDPQLLAVDGGIRLGYTLNPFLGGKLEPYGGFSYDRHLTLAYYEIDTNAEVSIVEVGNSGSLSIYVGARYQFGEKAGLFVELNPGYTAFKIGFVFKKF